MASVNALAAMLFFVQMRGRNKKELKAKECCEDRFNLGGRWCVDTIPLASSHIRCPNRALADGVQTANRSAARPNAF